jgi:signal transduction histidine kinase
MKRYKLTPHLGIFFIGAVVIPSVILALIAVRAINREEAYIEKSLQGTLLAEVTHAVSLVAGELEKVREELGRTAPAGAGEPAAWADWKQASPLVQGPFLLSPGFEILRPRFGADATHEEIAFLKRYGEFLTDRMEVPYYQNIAIANKEEILNQAVQTNARAQVAQASVPTPPAEANQKLNSSDAYEGQVAMSEFQQSESVRKRVYEQAKGKGQQTLSRSVKVQQQQVGQGADIHFESQSMFISEPRKFSEITSKGESGFIPRFFDDSLTLLFWKKTADGQTIGCVIDGNRLRQRIAGAAPEVYSAARILTVLDEKGKPLIAPQEKIRRDWSIPFVSREISEVLPRWEAAAYLTDPRIISSRAHVTTVVLWTLVFILFVSIAGGGAMVLSALRHEITLAQQKTTFVSNVSHELKTPLTSIRMFAEMLAEKPNLDVEKRGKYLGIMVSETERLARLINNVLDFARMEQGKKQYNTKRLDLVLLLENIVESQRVRFEHNGFELGFAADVGRLEVIADEEVIKQAVLNLFSNAEKYSSGTKKIEVDVTRVDTFALVSIKDRGIGIPPEHAKNIFREFYRVDDSLTSRVKGTGLGLTIAGRIVQDQGGDILYFPRDGGGSIFQIKLPLAAGDGAEEEPVRP